MKANTPEKIQVHLVKNDYDDWSIEGYSFLSDKQLGMTEYTRTDAFIEKAMKFLYDYNQNMVKKHGARAVLGCSEFTINVYDFRKYMEGE